MSITLEQARTLLSNEITKYQNENKEHIKTIADLDAKNTNQDNLKVKHENFRIGFTKRALIILIATEQLLSKRFETQLNSRKSNIEKEINNLRDYVNQYQKEMKIPANSPFIKSITAELEAIKQITNNSYEAALKNNVNKRNITLAPQNLRNALDADAMRKIATQIIALHESVRAKTRPNEDDIEKEKQLYIKYEKLEKIMQKSGTIDKQSVDTVKKVHDLFKTYKSISDIPFDDQVEYLATYLRVYHELKLQRENERLDLADLVILNNLQSKIISLYVQIPLQLLTNDLRNQYKNFRESIQAKQQEYPTESQENNTSDRPDSWSEYFASVGYSTQESAKRGASSLPIYPTYEKTEQAAFNIERYNILQKIEAFETGLRKAQERIIPQEYNQQMIIIDYRKKLLNSKHIIEFNNNWLALNKAVTEFIDMMNKIYYSQKLNKLPARVANMLNYIKYRIALDYVATSISLNISIDIPDIIENPVAEQDVTNQVTEDLIYTGLKEKYLILEKINQNKTEVFNEINKLQKNLLQAKDENQQYIEQQLAHLKNKLNVYNYQERLLNIKVVNVKAIDIYYEQLLEATQKLKTSDKENMSEFEAANKEIHAITLRSIGVDPSTHRRSTELDFKTPQVTQKRDKPVASQLDPKVLGQELFAVYKELASKLELFNLDIASTDADYRQINNLHIKLKQLHSAIGLSHEIQNRISQELDTIFKELSSDQKTVKMIIKQLGQPNLDDFLINAEAAINKLPEIIDARKNAKDRLLSKNSKELNRKIEELMRERDQFIKLMKGTSTQQQVKSRTRNESEILSEFKNQIILLRKKYDELKRELSAQNPLDHKTAMSMQSGNEQLENARAKLEEAEKIIADPQNLTRQEYQKLPHTRWVRSNTEIYQHQRSQNKT